MPSDSARDLPLEELIGTEIGRFRVLARIGAGGMGVVFRALDTSLKREVALKFLPDHLAADAERLARFEREAESVAALNHPSIVTLYSVEEARGCRFLAMELVEGESLDRVIPRGGLPIDRFFDLAIPLADALAAAHARHIVHRDLKPANVMVTAGGLVKVLDFGLAKLFEPEPEAGEDDATELLPEGLTREGVVAGSPGYMSPEQLRAGPIDHRTDLFSLGLVLYQMATGRRAFTGRSWADVQTATLRDEPPGLGEVRAELPRHLGRIVGQCLEKDVDKRLQSAADLRNQLAGLKKELETDRILDRATRSGRIAGAPRPSRRWLPWAAGALLAAGALAAALLLPRGAERAGPSPPAAPPPPTGVDAPPPRTLAILPFRNLTGAPELDWLRSGIPEMMATSLAQAPGLEVLDSRAVGRALGALDFADRSDWPAAELGSFARQAGVARVLHGSFGRLGGTYRVDLQVQDAATARVVAAAEAQGEGDASLFSMVDRLSRSVLDKLELPRAPASEKEQGLAQATTDSIEAYRYYAEGVRLRNEIKGQESIPMFERALEIDPGFAMALSALGTSYLNLGNEALAREYARRAFESSARAPTRERYFIQGRYLSLDWATYGEAIAALERTVDQYPDHAQARNILANRLAALDDFAAAIPHLERLVADNPGFGGNAWLLSTLYAAEGRFDDARAVVADFRQRYPENWYGPLLSALLSLREGRPSEALAALAAADDLRPGTNEVLELRWAAYVQSDRWAEAEAAARVQAASDDPYYRWAGNVYLARTALYRGQAAEALAALAASRRPFERPGALAALSHAWEAELRLERGEGAAAREPAEAAQRAGRGQWPELYGLFLAGLTAQAEGRADEADRLLAELERRAQAYPNAVERRQILHLDGRLAHARGDAERALEQLTRAAALLPPHGLYYLDRYRLLPDHTPVWYALATALRDAGRDAEAAGWFEQIVERRVESRNEPVRWARSLFHLAEIRQAQGRLDEARDHYRRFVELWGEGDLDRARVATARGRLR